jgi:hypothetical protein
MKKAHWLLTALTFLLAFPFLVLSGMSLLGQAGGSPLFQILSRLPTVLTANLVAPGFFAALLFSRMERYLAFSLAVIVLGMAALVWLMVAERRAALRRGRFWILALALAATIAAPGLLAYQPAVKAAPGWTLRMVEPPGPLEGFVRTCQAAAEVPGECQYEPLGWADEETLVYRKWCGGHFVVGRENAPSEWDPGIPGILLAYSVTTGDVAPFEGDPTSLHHQTCDPNRCVQPGLALAPGFPPPGYFAGYFGDPLLSPDGRRVAFTARHVYGPEDLLVIER